MEKSSEHNIAAVVIGGSAGSLKPLRQIIKGLPKDFLATVVIVIHLHPSSSARVLAQQLGEFTPLPVKEADDKEAIKTGTIYLAPANYHLLVERQRRFSLSIDDRVKYSRPSIDVLFESAAEAWQEELVGVLLSGGSDDGVDGLQRIQRLGGKILIQDPATAEMALMPQAAADRLQLDGVFPAEQLAVWLREHV